VAGVWRWDGRIESQILVGDWKLGQPDKIHEDCLAQLKDHKWHNINCGRNNLLLTACEYLA